MSAFTWSSPSLVISGIRSFPPHRCLLSGRADESRLLFFQTLRDELNMLIASEGFVVRSGSALDDGGNGHPGNCGSYPGHNEAHPGFARLKVRVLVLDAPINKED